VRTAHQELEIWKSDLATEFRVAGAVHAFYHRRRFLTGLVWDMLAASALLGTREEPRSVLMLGLAGGTSLRTLRHLLPACRFTAIDIDGEIVRLAQQHMALDATGVEVIIGDAYEWGHRAMQSATRRILRESFREVRSVKAPAAMNEVLVAGQSVGTALRLRKWDSCFSDGADRGYWRRIAVRRIGRVKA